MDLTLPRFEQSDETEITKILVSEGEEVGPDQTLVETRAGKIKSPRRAMVGRIHVRPGSRIRVGEAVLSLEEPNDTAPESRLNGGLEEGPVSVEPQEPLMDELKNPESA